MERLTNAQLQTCVVHRKRGLSFTEIGRIVQRHPQSIRDAVNSQRGKDMARRQFSDYRKLLTVPPLPSEKTQWPGRRFNWWATMRCEKGRRARAMDEFQRLGQEYEAAMKEATESR